MRELRKKNSVSVFNDNEYALELFQNDGVPGSFIDIQFKEMSQLLLTSFYNVEIPDKAPKPITYWLSLETLENKFPFDKKETLLVTEKSGYNSSAV